MGSTRFIVKVQISLNDGGKSIVVYNQDRSVMSVLETTPELRKLFRGRPKFYCYATFKKHGVLVLEDEVPVQDW